MPSARARRAVLVLAAALCAVPARALYRTGSLLWRYDDISTRDPSGSRRRTSWYQGYEGEVGGSLLHPAVGQFQTGGSFTKGADINSAVNEDVPEQTIVTYRAAVQPFAPNLRRR